MEKIYKDFFDKLDEKQKNFFKVQLKKIYEEKLEQVEKKPLNQVFDNYQAIRQALEEQRKKYLFGNSWETKKDDDALDEFILYLESQNLIKKIYDRTDDIIICKDKYRFCITEVGFNFFKYIIKQI